MSSSTTASNSSRSPSSSDENVNQPSPPQPITITIDPTPILTLSHLNIHLRPFLPTDTPSLAHHANNPRIPINMTNMFPSPYTLASAKSWITFSSHTEAGRMPCFKDSSERWEERRCSSWAVVWTGRGGEGKEEVVGSIGLKCGSVGDVHGRSAEVGYWLGEEFWGRGWMTEVLAGFVAWVWRTFPVNGSASRSAGGKIDSGGGGGGDVGTTTLTIEAEAATSSPSAKTTTPTPTPTPPTNSTTTTTTTQTQTHPPTPRYRAPGLDRLEAGVFAWNACGSGKVLEKCGFQKVGLLRGKVWKVIEGEERRCDLEIWDMLRDE